MRKEVSPEAEKALKNKNSLKQIRSVGENVKTDVAESIQPVIDLLADVMRWLELRGKNFEVEEACSESDVENFWEILLQIEPSLTPEDTARDKVKDKNELHSFFSHCCQMRNYSFCIRKCGKDDCSICRPVRTKFEQLRFLPDPIMQEDGHYLFTI